jgi:hypothetical protein
LYLLVVFGVATRLPSSLLCFEMDGWFTDWEGVYGGYLEYLCYLPCLVCMLCSLGFDNGVEVDSGNAIGDYQGDGIGGNGLGNWKGRHIEIRSIN